MKVPVSCQPAVGLWNQADFPAEEFPRTERVGILPAIPERNALIGTYAYPGNARLDFRDKEKPVLLFADVFEGRMLEVLGPHERFLRYEHFETSIDARAGASGGPVFHPSGHACAVNCRGWDLGSEPECGPLSSVVPIEPVLGLRVPMPHMPVGSLSQIQCRQRGGELRRPFAS